jgi:hypothetical protein
MQTYCQKENNLVLYQYPELKQIIEGSYESTKYDERYHLMDDFRTTCKTWLESGNKTKIKGLDRFKYVYVLNGVSQFVTDLVKFEDRLIDIHRTEYLGYKSMIEIYSLPHCYHKSYETMGSNNNNVVVVSYPASLLGNDDESLVKLLTVSKSKIILDSVFLGTNTFDVDLDFNILTQVESFLFSFSKGFNLGSHRIGIMFTDKFIPEYDIFHSYAYINLHGMQVASKIMEKYNLDYFSDKYKERQMQVCNQLNIEPSGCVHLGLDRDLSNPDRKIKITHLFDKL